MFWVTRAPKKGTMLLCPFRFADTSTCSVSGRFEAAGGGGGGAALPSPRNISLFLLASEFEFEYWVDRTYPSKPIPVKSATSIIIITEGENS